MEGILISFLYLLLHLAIIVFVAVCIVWGFKFIGVTIDGDVYKWGRIIVMLLCVIAVAVWLFSILGYGPGLYGPRVTPLVR